MPSRIPRLGNWAVSGQTQTAGTAILQLIQPWPGRRNGRPLYNASTLNWLQNGGAITHVTSLSLLEGSTAHLGYVLKPLNYTTVSTAAAAGATTLVLTADPGIYSTNFKYPVPNGGTYPLNVADNGIATNDYVAYQLADGTWQAAKVTAVSTLTITVAALPSPTGTGSVLLAGALCYFFGVGTDVNPNNAQTAQAFEPNVSAVTTYSDADGLASALFPGDPLIFLDANATAADTLGVVSGYYGKW